MKKAQPASAASQNPSDQPSTVKEQEPSQQHHKIDIPQDKIKINLRSGALPKSQSTKKITERASHNRKSTIDRHKKQPDPKEISQIVKKKRQLSEQLARLQLQESQLKEKSKNKVNRNQRSHITKPEIMAIHRALEARKQFEESCEKKKEVYEQKIREKQIKDEQEREQSMEKLRQLKKEEVAQHIKQIKQRQLERIKELRQRNKAFQQVKKQKYTHEKIQEDWKAFELRQKQSQKNLLKDLNQSRSISMGSISEHEHRYLTQRQKQQQQKQEQFKLQRLSRLQVEKVTLSRFQPSKFLRTIFQEEEQKRRKQIQQQLQYRTYSLKKTQYGEEVRKSHMFSWKSHHLKPIKEKSRVKEQKQDKASTPQKHRSQSLNQFQIMKLGNSYMRQIHSSIGYADHIQSQSKEAPATPLQKYEDYLTPMRKERQSTSAQNPQAFEVKQLKSVMRKDMPMGDKIYQVKLITSKLQSKSHQPDSKTMLASINAKLSILNNLLKVI